MAGNPEFQRGIGSIDELIHRVESAADPHLQTVVRELVEAVMRLHGDGLERVLELLRAEGEPGLEIIDKLGRDELVSNLMVLHELHPASMEVRVKRALDTIRPSLKKRAAEAELVSVGDGMVRIKLYSTTHFEGLREMVEEALYRTAPDIVSLEIEGAGERPGFVPLASIRAAPEAALVSNGHASKDQAAGEGGL